MRVLILVEGSTPVEAEFADMPSVGDCIDTADPGYFFHVVAIHWRVGVPGSPVEPPRLRVEKWGPGGRE